MAALLLCCQGAAATDLSPATWNADARRRAEQLEAQTWTPPTARHVRGEGGMIAATVSPIAVLAGQETLRRGGNAADAAVAVALTQVSTELGSVVSYAGIAEVLYYEAKSGRVYSLDAGYNSYAGETDPMSISPSDISALTGGPPPAAIKDFGRQTLVPGFMAGMEALQSRFGRLRFGDLFAPAIWYAEHGVTISPVLQSFFVQRRSYLSRTESGRRFLRGTGGEFPKAGETFRQPDLAATLRAVAAHGSQEMYRGAWAQAFVAAVQADGGKATGEDLARYRPQWRNAPMAKVWGHRVFTNADDSQSAYRFLTGLAVAEALGFDRRDAYWRDAKVFLDLQRIADVLANAPGLPPETAALLRSAGIDVSPQAQRGKDFAAALAARLPALYAASPAVEPHHSNAIVAVDRYGNIAVVTHTVNAVMWGDTGIVVGGIPIPDSAGFQQARLAAIAPGARLPNDITDVIAFDAAGRPVLATASIGGGLLPESLRIAIGVIGQGRDLAAVVAAPPVLAPVDVATFAQPLKDWPTMIPADAYDPAFVAALRASGAKVAELPAETVAAIRGTVAAVAIAPNGDRAAAEVPGVMVFGGAE